MIRMSTNNNNVKNYETMLDTKWNTENYKTNCMESYYAQFAKPASAGTSQNSSTIESKVNKMTRIFNEVVMFCNQTFKNPASHTLEIFERRLLIDNIMEYSSYIIKKEPYKVKDSAKPDVVKTSKTFALKPSKVYDVVVPNYPYKPLNPTIWKLSEVSEEEFNKNECDLMHYNALKKDMFDKYEQVETIKRKIKELECVERFKNIERQLKEYKRELEDSRKRLELHAKLEADEKVGLLKFSKNERHIKKISDKATYQKKLQSALSELIKYSEKSLEVAEYKMQQNKDYVELSDKLTSEKLSYSLALRKVTDYRKKFFKYKVAPKTARWKHGKKVSGLHWYPVKDIRYMKSYDKVTFDYDKMELKLH